MKIYGASISKSRSDDQIWLKFDESDTWYGSFKVTEDQKALIDKLYDNRSSDEVVVKSIVEDLRNLILFNNEAVVERKRKAQQFSENMINFFKEFDYSPSMRFLNTIARMDNRDEVLKYVANYFELSDNNYADEISNKVRSAEFRRILEIMDFKPSNVVNKRLKIYYGPAGTGKTTKAVEESKGECVVCHSAMLPSDLMEDFKFNDGKADFTPSALQIAMTEGKTIVMDEVNLLPFESLRFLQSITDNKSEIVYKGRTVKIDDNFKIIGTMNLTVNGVAYALPEPLIDRCEDIKKFDLTAEMLSGVLI